MQPTPRHSRPARRAHARLRMEVTGAWRAFEMSKDEMCLTRLIICEKNGAFMWTKKVESDEGKLVSGKSVDTGVARSKESVCVVLRVSHGHKLVRTFGLSG